MMFLKTVLTIVFFGLIMWLVNTYVPMPGVMITIINIVIVLGTIAYLMRIFSVI